MKPFVNLHTHSFYSILEGAMSPQTILDTANQIGCPAVALTDNGFGHGLIEFVQKSADFPDVKPILGSEFYVAKDSRFERRAGIDGREGKLILIAQTNQGWQNLVKLMSVSALEGMCDHPRVDLELLEKHKAGLIALTGSIDGVIGKTLHERGENSAREYLEKIRGIFGEQLCLEIIGRTGDRFELLNNFVVQLASQSNLKTVVTSNARYPKPEDEEAAETLYCIGQNQIVNDPHRPKFSAENWFKNWRELTETLPYISDDLLEKSRLNTLAIAESVDVTIEFGKNLLPEFPLPDSETPATQLRKNCEAQIINLYSTDLGLDWNADQRKQSSEQIQSGKIKWKELNLNLQKKSAEFLTEINERLDYELSIIGKMGFEAYFLIVEDFIQFAKASDIAVGPGRGSAAGSIVSYLLGITTVDPLKYELLFERFLNPERISMPDIDIDFSDERRAEVLQYVIEKYGAEKVSKVCTFGTLSAKAALKDVGRAQGVPYADMNVLTKLLPGTPGFKLEDALSVKDFKTKIDANPSFKKVFEVALKLEGSVRHVSVHACAVIIGKDDLSAEIPLMWAPGAEEVKISQLPYQQLEAMGLLKMDFLGLKNLSVIEKALQHINGEKKSAEIAAVSAEASAKVEEDLDLSQIPIDDAKSFAMMAQGETTGVFQFESDGMRRYLRELKPTEFEDLVAMNALYRPGPMEYIPDYIEGKHNPDSVKYMHEVLEPILRKTYGIAVYQEQVLKIAQVFAGFSLGEADILRKAIGKKIASILSKQREKFISGAIEKGFAKKLAEKIFDDIIVPFSGYGFNRSHAVCYARIAYETAYLRANYPVEFMAAMMTADRNNTDRIVLEMNECSLMNIEVLPPGVNDSGSYFSVIEAKKESAVSSEALAKGKENLPKPKALFLSGPPGVGKTTVAALIAKETGAVHINVDEIKAELFGEENIHENPDKHDQLYDTVFQKITDATEAGNNVIADYIVLQNGWKKSAEFCQKHEIETQLIALMADASEIITRDESRAHEAGPNRIKELCQTFNDWKVANPKLKIIETDKKSPEFIVCDVMRNFDLDNTPKKRIRFGLTAIKGLGEDTVDLIIEERKIRGKFRSLQDFAERIPQKLLNKKTLEALSFSGALDEFGDRRAIVDSLEDLAQYAKEFQEKKEGGQIGLFGAETAAVAFKIKTTKASKEDILNWERESLGLFVSDHPLKGLDGYFEKFGKLIGKLDESLTGKKVKLHGIITHVRKIVTKTGKNMAILALEDTSGKIELAVFPQAYEKNDLRCYERDAFLKVEGKLEDRDGKMNIIVESLKLGNLKQIQSVHGNNKATDLSEELKIISPEQSRGKKEESSLPEKIPRNFSQSEQKKTEKQSPPLIIRIPDGTEKTTVDRVKIILKNNKIDQNGQAVKVQIKGKEVTIPFQISPKPEIKREIDELLSQTVKKSAASSDLFFGALVKEKALAKEEEISPKQTPKAKKSKFPLPDIYGFEF